MAEEAIIQVKVKQEVLDAIRKNHPEYKEIPAVHLVDQILRLFLEDKT